MKLVNGESVLTVTCGNMSHEHWCDVHALHYILFRVVTFVTTFCSNVMKFEYQ
jgi:hypothetical protein